MRPGKIPRQLISGVVLAFWILLGAISSARAEHLPVRFYTSADGLGSSFVNYLIA